MGIKDLLRALSSEMTSKLITDFKGKRIAIDSSGWLHKGLYAAAEDIVDSGEDSELYVDFILARARNFILNGVEPVFVFDGKRNNLKSDTSKKRDETRSALIESGNKLIENLNKTSDSACKMKLRQEAIVCFQRGLDVTHSMEKSTIAALRKLNIKCIVAPYEADAQLAYLCAIGYCDAVLTEDSDLIVYSAICSKPFPILFKFDKSGSVQCLDIQTLGLAPNNSNNNSNNDSNNTNNKMETSSGFKGNLKHFTGSNGRRMFVQMCIMAGCDYHESIHGIGLISAQQAIIRTKLSSDDSRFADVLQNLKAAKKVIPEGYLERALRVEALFYYQPVYNPYQKCVLPFTATPTPTPTPSFDTNNSYPSVDVLTLRSLGTAEDLMKCFPAGMKLVDACEGLRSCKDFSCIDPNFPWENGKASHPKDGNYGRSCWFVRKNMILFLKNQNNSYNMNALLKPLNPNTSSENQVSSSSSSSSSSGSSSGNFVHTKNENILNHSNNKPIHMPSERTNSTSSNKSSSGPEKYPNPNTTSILIEAAENIRDIMHPPPLPMDNTFRPYLSVVSSQLIKTDILTDSISDSPKIMSQFQGKSLFKSSPQTVKEQSIMNKSKNMDYSLNKQSIFTNTPAVVVPGPVSNLSENAVANTNNFVSCFNPFVKKEIKITPSSACDLEIITETPPEEGVTSFMDISPHAKFNSNDSSSYESIDISIQRNTLLSKSNTLQKPLLLASENKENIDPKLSKLSIHTNPSSNVLKRKAPVEIVSIQSKGKKSKVGNTIKVASIRSFFG